MLQGYVSRLRKVLGREAIVTRGRGYVLVAGDGAVDLCRFDVLLSSGAAALRDGDPGEAARELRAALALWRGAALADLADEPFARSIAARLDELRLVATERAVQADLACGRHDAVVAELEALVARHPLREGLRVLQMLALYRSGRQADALAAYRAACTTLREQVGIEPGDGTTGARRRDPAPGSGARPAARGAGTDAVAPPARTVLVAAFSLAAMPPLAALGELLAEAPVHELVLAATVPQVDELESAGRELEVLRAESAARGVGARAAAFTSLMPGADFARLAVEQDADLLIVDAPRGLLEDAGLLTLLDDAPCDVAVAVGDRRIGDGPVLVPFSGATHDWAAVELGAWLARALDRSLHLAGASTGATGRDASRLLASASLAVQRALGVAAQPLLVDPAPAALVATGSDAGVVVVGLTDRWRREGLGRARTALATSHASTTLLVRRGLRPGGLRHARATPASRGRLRRAAHDQRAHRGGGARRAAPRLRSGSESGGKQSADGAVHGGNGPGSG